MRNYVAPVELALKEWSEHEAEAENKQEAVIRALFLSVPTLQSFVLAYRNKIEGMSFSFSMAFLVKLNHISLEEDLCLNIARYTLPQTEWFKSWLVEVNLTYEEFSIMIKSLSELRRDYLCNYVYRREDYCQESN